MGLSLTISLFRAAEAQEVYRLYGEFYAQRGRPLMPPAEDTRDYEVSTVYDEDQGWVVINHRSAGWKWEELQEAQQLITGRLGCVGMVIFVDDGDYWG